MSMRCFPSYLTSSRTSISGHHHIGLKLICLLAAPLKAMFPSLCNLCLPEKWCQSNKNHHILDPQKYPYTAGNDLRNP